MNLRIAEEKDEAACKSMYKEIVRAMREKGEPIWSEYYPAEFLIYDIKARRLFIAENGKNEITGAFALDTDPYDLEWEDKAAPALYLERLAVAMSERGTGLSVELMEKAEEEARKRGAHYLRLFVVKENARALKLYEKCGWTRLEGLLDLEVDTDVILHGYGLEKKII